MCKGQLPGTREALTWTWRQERIEERTEDQGQTIVLSDTKQEETTKGGLVVKRDSPGWDCTVRWYGTALRRFAGSAGALIYSGGVQRRVAGSREEARSSGEVLCSCGGRAG